MGDQHDQSYGLKKFNFFALDIRLKKSYYWQKKYNASLVGHKEGTKV